MHRLALRSFCGLVLLLAAGPVLAASIPVPGVGVVVKKHPGNTAARFGAPDLAAIPAGFFGAGSQEFSGIVGLQGPCDLPCNPCNCADLRIDYSMDTTAGPFESSLVPFTLHSVSPITVSNSSGIDSFFDVWLELQPLGGSILVNGSLSVSPGTSLAPGSSSFVVDSFFDIEYRITFTEAGTSTTAGQPLTGSLQLVLQDSNLPISCVDDGSANGFFVMGLGGSGLQSFTHASSGGALYLEMESLYEPAVANETVSWGAAKSLFR